MPIGQATAMLGLLRVLILVFMRQFPRVTLTLAPQFFSASKAAFAMNLL
jgi:hypothetical protein